MAKELHELVSQTVLKITGTQVQTERAACAALIAYLTQQQVADLIMDREDLKLLIELAIIYSEEKEAELLTPEFYTVLAGLEGVFARFSKVLKKDCDEKHIAKIKEVCDVVVGLFPFVAYEFTNGNTIAVRFSHAVTEQYLFTLMEWSPVKDVKGEYSTCVRFSPEIIPSKEEPKNVIPEKYTTDRFRWSQKGRKDRAWYCYYLSMGQLYDLLSSNPEILRPDELH